MEHYLELLNLGMPPEKAFYLPIDVLVKQYNYQPDIEQIPNEFVEYWLNWRVQRGCPPALIYQADGRLSRETPIHLIDISMLDSLRKKFTRNKGETVCIEYFLADKICVAENMSFEYDQNFVPLVKMTETVYFYDSGEVAHRKTKIIYLDDKAIAYSLRQARFRQNFQDVIFCLNEIVNVSEQVLFELNQITAPYMTLYYNGSPAPVLQVIEQYQGLDAEVKNELIERLTP
jgi:hypothetical protein